MSLEEDRVYICDSNLLPKNRCATNLPEILGKDGVFADGDWVESKDQDANGDVRLIQLADVGDGEYRDRSARFLTSQKARELCCTFLEKGDVLVARMPDPLGRACIFPGDAKRAVTVVDVAVVRPSNPVVNERWLMYRINTPAFRGAVSSMQSGSTRQRISRRNLAKITFELPTRELQDAAVGEIEKQFSRLDDAVANLKRVKANLKRYKAAVLKAAVEGRLVPTEAELARREGCDFESGTQLLERVFNARRGRRIRKDRESLAPGKRNSRACPDGWSSAKVGDIGDVISGLTKNPKREFLPEKLPYLRVANVYANELRLDDVVEIGVAPGELEKLLLRQGDLLIVEGNGSPDQIGRAALWDGSIESCVHQNHLIKVRPTFVSSAFILDWLLSPHGRTEIELVSSSTSGLHTLSTGKIANLLVPIPPLAEQHRIVAEIERRLSLIRRIDLDVETNLRRAMGLRQSVLRKQFAANYQEMPNG